MEQTNETIDTNNNPIENSVDDIKEDEMNNENEPHSDGDDSNESGDDITETPKPNPYEYIDLDEELRKDRLLCMKQTIVISLISAYALAIGILIFC